MRAFDENTLLQSRSRLYLWLHSWASLHSSCMEACGANPLCRDQRIL